MLSNGILFVLQIRQVNFSFTVILNSVQFNRNYRISNLMSVDIFQYVGLLCDKVTDYCGPEIYIYFFTTN